MPRHATSFTIITTLLWLTSQVATAQTPPRTPWGDPDLQGVWTGSTLTPLERPTDLAEKPFLTEEEAAALETRADQARFVERTVTSGDPGTYNQIWFDPGTRVVPDRRTALIVDPPDGRIPYTPAMRERERLQIDYRVNGARHSWVDVDTGERCLTDGVPMFWLGYNPNHQILQTPDHVVIVHEMFRDRRIIPLADRRPGGVPQWNGDIHGRWEGETLVVDSTFFVDRTQDRWAATWRMPTSTMHLVERFRRLDADTLEYEFTLTDPAKFTRPWTARIPLTTNQAERGVTQGPVYEYACHEGNYSLANVLTGARVEALEAPVTTGMNESGDDATTLTTLSARPGMVTGGDVLVEVSLPAGTDVASVRLRAGTRDVTRSLRATPHGTWSALVDGLQPGSTTLVLENAAGGGLASLPLVNHDAQGPVFSGPHETPFLCETHAFELVSGETLGTPLDDTCRVTRRVDYAYRPATGDALEPLDPARPPTDVARVEVNGTEVPYVVRIETGTANRAIYQIAMLHDPTDTAPDPWTPSPGWNGRLIYTFGGGCVNGWYRQGRSTGGVTDDVMLRQGYAVASSSLNVFGNNCNDVLAAETMMMVKERFIEAYGVPRHTIGWGCSGGSYQNHQIADNYPGLLDGILPGCSFPDVGFGTIPMITDARLLNHYFDGQASVAFSHAAQRAVAGFLTLATMPNVARNAGRIQVNEFCPDVLPEVSRYHPTDNPGGARCDVYAHHVNIFGRDPDTGFARRPLDNVGVQFGLGALNAGQISVAQFLDLNEKIGGYDADGNFQSARTVADPEAVRIAYETGRLTHGGGGLATTPIIDYRAYSDDREDGDVHVRYHSFSIRDRLRKANGTTDNHVMLVEDDRYGLYSSDSPVLREALRLMDRWLDNLAHDTTAAPRIEQIRRARPDELTDTCWTRDDDPQPIEEDQRRDVGRCAELYPAPPAPREVAGAPVASDIIKCRLKPVDPADYHATLSAEETARLRTIFPDGVCDWSKPGVGQVPLKGTWRSFGPAS